MGKQGADLDVRKTLWTWAGDAEPKLKTLDDTTDVEPWLGDRAGPALLPGGTKDKPNVAVAVAVKDEAKAKAGIDKISGTAGGSTDLDVTTKDGFALVTQKGDGAAVLADLAKGSLATNSTYTGDMSALGDTGIASAWVDSKGLGDLAKSLAAGSTPGRRRWTPRSWPQPAGSPWRSASTPTTSSSLRGGHAVGKSTSAQKRAGAASLPEDTMAALQVNGLGDTVATTWRQISKAIPADTLSQVESQLGVTLPGDLQLVLGQSLTIALPKQDLTAVSGADLPTVGIRDLTSDSSRVGALLTKISQLGGADNLVKHGVDGNTIYLATTD